MLAKESNVARLVHKSRYFFCNVDTEASFSPNPGLALMSHVTSGVNPQHTVYGVSRTAQSSFEVTLPV